MPRPDAADRPAPPGSQRAPPETFATGDVARALLRSLVHDLATSLGVCAAVVEMARRGEATDDELDEALQVLGAVRRRLSSIGQAERGLSHGHSVGVPMRPCIAQALLLLEPGQRSTVTVLGDATVRGDEAMLTIVLQNLMANALRHADAARPVVRVVVQEEAAGVRITVWNNGDAIAPGALERYLRPYAQGGRPGHSGLGLAIASGLLAALDSRLQEDPPEGGLGGTAISFLLAPATG